MKKKVKGNIFLLITAFIWGSTFIAQSEGMAYIGPFTYNMARNILAFIVLIPLIYFLSRKNKDKKKYDTKTTLLGGVICGLILGLGSAFQQAGIVYTTAGKAGFISALYIIFVPLFAFFIGKKVKKIIWLCIIIAIVGFYLLCIKSDFSIGKGDLLIFISTFFYTAHILIVDSLTDKKADPVKMSWIQFAAAFALSALLAFSLESPSITAIWDTKITILYAGILSSGIAFTLQIIGQKDTDASTATLILCLESIFAALSGWLILGERLSLQEFVGCALVFTAVILSNLPALKRKA